MELETGIAPTSFATQMTGVGRQVTVGGGDVLFVVSLAVTHDVTMGALHRPRLPHRARVVRRPGRKVSGLLTVLLTASSICRIEQSSF